MITFVGMGPGDPELMTLAAVRALREADVIAYPETDNGRSVVCAIAGDLMEGKELLPLHMPMVGRRGNWEESHMNAAQALREVLDAGKNVAYPVLGDPMLYATSSYLHRLLAADYDTKVIPGITAMCAAAAAWQTPLCEEREILEVRPGYTEGDSLPDHNVVIMKAGRALDAIETAGEGREMYLARNLGMPEGSYAGPLKDADKDAVSYFSTVLVKPKKA